MDSSYPHQESKLCQGFLCTQTESSLRLTACPGHQVLAHVMAVLTEAG